MTESVHAQWVARGREAQAAGHPIDAFLCFREAIRADDRGADAHYHLGEVLWQLGRPAGAIAAWRDALRVAPSFLAPAQALAEGLLATADPAGAAQAAARVLALAPGNARAELIAGVASLLQGAGNAGAAVQRIGAALAREPSLVTVPSLAGPLALAIERPTVATARAILVDHVIRATGADAAAMPVSLLAPCCEHAAASGHAADAAALFVAARDRSANDHEALRRVALAAARVTTADAAALARRYADLCVAAFGTPAPLVWPRRTAGAQWRVVVLTTATEEGARALGELAAALPREAFDVLGAAIGAVPRELARRAAEAGARLVGLPGEPDIDVAKALAVGDPDVLVDVTGLAAAIGPLLAARPARAVWSVAHVAPPNAPPLVDRVFPGAGELAAALREARTAHDANGDCPLPAAELAAAWEEALRAHQRGDRASARSTYARVLALQPGFATAHYLAGVAARDDGDAEAARREFTAALAAAPRYVDARLAAVRAATEAHDAGAAVDVCEAGLAQAPANAPLWRALGHAQLARHDGARAAAAFERALALDPTDADTHYNLGVALQAQGALPGAARAYQHALAFAPDLVSARFNLAVVFQAQRAVDAAIAAYEDVLVAEPRHVAAHKNLGEALFAAGRYDAWLASFRRFETNCPTALPLAVQALEACQWQGDFAKLDRYLDGLAHEAFRPADELELVDSLEELLYLLLFFDVDPETTLRFARTYDGAAKHVYGEPLPQAPVRRPGRLRIGYLSADLRDHVMGKMMWQAIRHHDRSRFELFFYALSRESDAWTERFRSVADRFDVIEGLPERAAAARIAGDDLDVLVDLSTHTRGARPGILAFKPARVQITHVASAGTVGLSAIDFKLTDRHADVAESQPYQIETLLPMDGCVYPYRHIAPPAAHPFRRDALGIPADAVVIGAFVSALKLSRRCLALWREVLDRVPRAIVAFSPADPAARELYLRIAKAAGIEPSRVVFVPQGRDEGENQARYALVDLVLDPMPFGGANGTLEALDMGVPVVTLVGRRHGERVAYSILIHLGVTETVAHSGTEYVTKAVRLATDPAFMADVRAAIARGIAGSVLTDMPRHARALEAAYEDALRRKCPGALDDAPR